MPLLDSRFDPNLPEVFLVDFIGTKFLVGWWLGCLTALGAVGWVVVRTILVVSFQVFSVV